ncbi:MAG: GNAT family N-acetyltransferase [Candidatus Eisenbacteria bacterium]
MIRYTDSTEGIAEEQLSGFFVGWPDPPSPATQMKILEGSHTVMLAIDDEESRVVGFVTAVSDGVLAAYIPLLEVLPEYRRHGIGSELVRRAMEKLDGLYMVDLVCDPQMESFYSRFGMKPAHAMAIRRYERQSGVE